MQNHFDGNSDVLIVGGGTAGLTVAARLRKKNQDLKITLLEPSAKHYYQPLWTLVGGGEVSFSQTEKDEQSLIPKGVDWVQDKATAFLPDDNVPQLVSGFLG